MHDTTSIAKTDSAGETAAIDGHQQQLRDFAEQLCELSVKQALEIITPEGMGQKLWKVVEDLADSGTPSHRRMSVGLATKLIRSVNDLLGTATRLAESGRSDASGHDHATSGVSVEVAIALISQGQSDRLMGTEAKPMLDAAESG